MQVYLMAALVLQNGIHGFWFAVENKIYEGVSKRFRAGSITK
jgi:hypothetical protein